jgi:hypothetical protein
MSIHGVWSSMFIICAIIQGAIITGLTISIVSTQILFSSKINIIQFLSLSFEGPAKWFFLGYIFYMILVVAIAVTATFYHHRWSIISYLTMSKYRICVRRCKKDDVFY